MNTRNIFQSLLAITIGTSAAHSGAAMPDTNLQNLMVVLRESEGENKKDVVLKPMGSAKATLADGKEVEMSFAWFSVIGDMHVRFVYDSPTSMRNLTSEEFSALKLTPDKALQIAVGNIKRVYGQPKVSPWQGGLLLVAGESPDLDSSYFLDSSFWQNLLKKYPSGVVVGVPKRGGLLFAPASDDKAVAGLRQGIRALFISSENMRVSSALYLFKNNRWSVFQDPQSQP